MEDKKFEQFIEQAKKVNLSAEERSLIKNSVINFMKDNPVRFKANSRLVYKNDEKPSFWPFNFIQGRSNIFLTKLNFTHNMAIILILTVLFGGGVSLGAEKALPGDTLYPIKVGINEEIRGWLTISEESKANWEVERAERRLEEAEKLASEGSFSSDVRANIEARFEAQSERVKLRIKRFETKDNFNAAVDVSSRFESSLEAHEKILDRLEVKAGSENQELNSIKARVRSQADKTRENREEVELKADGQVNADMNDEQDIDNEIDLEIESKLKLDSEDGSTEGGAKARVNLGL